MQTLPLMLNLTRRRLDKYLTQQHNATPRLYAQGARTICTVAVTQKQTSHWHRH